MDMEKSAQTSDSEDPVDEASPSNSDKLLRCRSMAHIPLNQCESPIISRARSFSPSVEPTLEEFSLQRQEWMAWDEKGFSTCEEAKQNIKKESVVVSPYTVSKCLCIILQDMMTASKNSNQPVKEFYSIFETPTTHGKTSKLAVPKIAPASDESTSPSPKPIPKWELPCLDAMTEFAHKICFNAQMEYECMVVALVYIQRMVTVSDGGFYITPSNWKGTALSCMMMASKVWDDFAMLNAEYCKIFPGLRVTRVNELEIALLEALKYDIYVTPKEYTAAHFALQHNITKDAIKNVKSMTALIKQKPVNNPKANISPAKVTPPTQRPRIVDKSGSFDLPIVVSSSRGSSEFLTPVKSLLNKSRSMSISQPTSPKVDENVPLPFTISNKFSHESKVQSVGSRHSQDSQTNSDVAHRQVIRSYSFKLKSMSHVDDSSCIMMEVVPKRNLTCCCALFSSKIQTFNHGDI
eukprot:CAMPEP_0185035926 /NCGR_PEP_ID=MMETSP1103-20130426/28080_1 /TAXON_ID=36769 /ORGANISM="Paraphysomonas bandaiensis, Strain Caron Lab Isolate" /LENGTH=463 /DNA_ID=CAMNT_0027573231 /DNA_START=107 /DNA_END=1498 /DNA_ORIENTATION=+